MATATDTIGGFPIADPNCKGCGKQLELENAWMTDGCPCNTPLGVNRALPTKAGVPSNSRQHFALAQKSHSGSRTAREPLEKNDAPPKKKGVLDDRC